MEYEWYFGTNRNKVTRLEGTTLLLTGFAGTSRAVLNQPLGVLWGGRFDRDAAGALILDSQGFPTAASTEGVLEILMPTLELV
jgi:hypothetical protein